METVYPASASALARGRRLRRADPRSRHRTTPVTFAEIKEVDEDNEDAIAANEERRRRPDLLDEPLGRQFAEFRARRARRARRDELRERDVEESPPLSSTARAGSEPSALHQAHENIRPHDT